jgi:SlyX protein
MSEAITRLEEKIAYLERHVVEQDKAMLEFGDELARLKRELNLMSGRLGSGAPAGAGETPIIEERPPHY